MKELSSLRMAPPDMIVLGKEKGESDKQQEGKKNFCSLSLYSIQALLISSRCGLGLMMIHGDLWRNFLEEQHLAV